MSLTPIYALRKWEPNEPARNTPAIMDQHADTLETALKNRGVPPSDLVNLIAAGWFTDTGVRTVVGAGSLGFTSNTGFDVTGLRLQKRAGLLHLWGAVTKASWASGDVVCVAPAGYRPNVDREGMCRIGSTYGILTWEAATGYLRIYTANSGSLGTAFAVVMPAVPAA